MQGCCTTWPQAVPDSLNIFDQIRRGVNEKHRHNRHTPEFNTVVMCPILDVQKLVWEPLSDELFK